jgi:hypothetical protein
VTKTNLTNFLVMGNKFGLVWMVANNLACTCSLANFGPFFVATLVKTWATKTLSKLSDSQIVRFAWDQTKPTPRYLTS